MRNQPTLSPSSPPVSVPVRAYLAATYTVPPPPLLLLRFSPPRLIQRAYHRAFRKRSFSLFRSASVRSKFSLAITATEFYLQSSAVTSRVSLIEFLPPPSFLGRVPWKRHGNCICTFLTRWISPPLPSFLVYTYTCKFERKFGRVFPGKLDTRGNDFIGGGREGDLVRDESM